MQKLYEWLSGKLMDRVGRVVGIVLLSVIGAIVLLGDRAFDREFWFLVPGIACTFGALSYVPQQPYRLPGKIFYLTNFGLYCLSMAVVLVKGLLYRLG